MIVRPARQEDAKLLIAMCRNSLALTYGEFLTREQMQPWIEGGETERYVAKMLDRMLVAEQDGQVRGVVSLDGDLLDLVWVALDQRGQGVGRQLMAAAEDQLRANGFDRARLKCFEPNRAAIRFYERQGYSIKETQLDGTLGVNEVVMTKELR